MMPWEREIYLELLKQYIEEKEAEKQQQQHG